MEVTVENILRHRCRQMGVNVLYLAQHTFVDIEQCTPENIESPNYTKILLQCEFCTNIA